MLQLLFKRAVFSLLTVFVIASPTWAESPPVLIGATVSLEGKYAETSKMIQKGYQYWAYKINQNGGLLDRPVKLILYDDKSRTDLVESLYEKLITKDKVDLVLSPYGTPLTTKASTITEKYNFTMLACAAAGEQIWNRGFKYVFGIYALADRYFIGFLDLLARNGYQSLGLVYESNAFNISIANGVRKWADRFGIEVRYDKRFDPSENQLPNIVSQLSTMEFDGLIFSGYPPAGYAFLDHSKQKGMKVKNLAMTIIPTYPDFYDRVGPFAEGIFGPSQWEPDERIPFPGTKQFIEGFINFTGRIPSYHAASAYSSCQILEKAVQQIKSVDQQEIRNFVNSFDTVTIMGRFKSDLTGRQIGHNPLLIQWQDSKKQIVYPTRMRTAKPLFNIKRK